MTERTVNAERMEQIIEVFGSFDENIRKILANAARWAAPRIIQQIDCPCVEPKENIKKKD